MNTLDKLQLIELKRHELSVLLRQATGIDVEIEATIFPTFQDTREIGRCAANVGWVVSETDGWRFVLSPRRAEHGRTHIHVPRDSSSLAKYEDADNNPLSSPPDQFAALSALVALGRLTSYVAEGEEG